MISEGQAGQQEKCCGSLVARCRLHHPPGVPILQSDIMEPEIGIDLGRAGLCAALRLCSGTCSPLAAIPTMEPESRGMGMLNPCPSASQPGPLCCYGDNKLVSLIS